MQAVKPSGTFVAVLRTPKWSYTEYSSFERLKRLADYALNTVLSSKYDSLLMFLKVAATKLQRHGTREIPVPELLQLDVKNLAMVGRGINIGISGVTPLRTT